MTHSASTVVFLHGAWMGPWIWDEVRSALSDVQTRVLEYPSTGSDPSRLGSLDDDVTALMDCIDKTQGRVMVVAHSYAGAVATAAPLPGRVEKVIYLAAFMLDAGNDFGSQHGGGDPPPWWTINAAPTGAYLTVEPAAARGVFFGDLPAEEAAQAAGRLRASSLAAQTAPMPRASWRERESLFVVCEQDEALPPFLQDRMAVQADRVRRLPSSHTPSLSMPGRLADLIEEEAAQGQ